MIYRLEPFKSCINRAKSCLQHTLFDVTCLASQGLTRGLLICYSPGCLPREELVTFLLDNNPVTQRSSLPGEELVTFLFNNNPVTQRGCLHWEELVTFLAIYNNPIIQRGSSAGFSVLLQPCQTAWQPSRERVGDFSVLLQPCHIAWQLSRGKVDSVSVLLQPFHTE